jgi:hypothetical protein
MTHVVVIVPGLGPIALTPDALRAARVKGRELVGETETTIAPPTTAAPLLVDASQLEERTGIPATWWMAQAREQRIPHQKIGRRVRFRLDEVMACEAVMRRKAA